MKLDEVTRHLQLQLSETAPKIQSPKFSRPGSLPAVVAWLLMIAAVASAPVQSTEPQVQDVFDTSPGAFSNTTASKWDAGLITQFNIEGYFNGTTNAFRCYHTDPYAPVKTTNDRLFPPAGVVNWNQGPIIPALNGSCCSGDQGYVDDNGRVCMTLTNSSNQTIEACVDCSTPANTVIRNIEITGTKISPRLARISDRLVVMVFDVPNDEADFYSRPFNATSWIDMNLSVPCDSPFSGRHGDLTSIPNGTHAFPLCFNGDQVDLYSIDAVSGTLNWTENIGVAGPPGLNFEYADAQYCPNLQHNVAVRFGNSVQGVQNIGMAFDVCDQVGPSNVTSIQVPIGTPGDVFGLNCNDHLAQVRMTGSSWDTYVGNFYFGDGTQGAPVSNEHLDPNSGVNFVSTYDPVGAAFGPVEHAWGRQPYAETYIGMNPRPGNDQEGPPTPQIRFGTQETPIFFHDFETGDTRYWSAIQGRPGS